MLDLQGKRNRSSPFSYPSFSSFRSDRSDPFSFESIPTSTPTSGGETDPFPCQNAPRRSRSKARFPSRSRTNALDLRSARSRGWFFFLGWTRVDPQLLLKTAFLIIGIPRANTMDPTRRLLASLAFLASLLVLVLSDEGNHKASLETFFTTDRILRKISWLTLSSRSLSSTVRRRGSREAVREQGWTLQQSTRDVQLLRASFLQAYGSSRAQAKAQVGWIG